MAADRWRGAAPAASRQFLNGWRNALLFSQTTVRPAQNIFRRFSRGHLRRYPQVGTLRSPWVSPFANMILISGSSAWSGIIKCVIDFHSSAGYTYGHVGIYVGNGHVIHAVSTVKKQSLSSLLQNYTYLGWGWQADVDLR